MKFLLSLFLLLALVFPNLALAQTPNGKTPLLIIPGILGTELYSGTDKLWPNIPKMLLSPTDKFMDALGFHADGSPVDSKVLPGQVVRKELTFDYTDMLVQNLQQLGYKLGQDLFLFAYDWRQDLAQTANTFLKNYLSHIQAQTGHSKINVIAHSQGGLLFKRLLFDNPSIDNLMGNVVFVGVPHLGAPKAAKVLLYGDDLEAGKFGLGLNSQEVKHIGQNMPSIYQLLPSDTYFFFNPGYLGLTNNGLTSWLRYGQTSQKLIDQGLNANLIQQAENFHHIGLDNYNFRNHQGRYYNIAGCGQATLGGISQSSSKKFQVQYRSGDGTVLYSSASFLGSVPLISVRAKKHANMLTEDGLRYHILGLATGIYTELGGEPAPVDDCGLNGRQISVHSPVDLHVYDELGRHVGPVSSGEVELQIPDAQYDIIEDNKFVFLPNGHNYTVKLQATDVGSFELRSSIIENEEITNTVEYGAIPITAQSSGHLLLNDDNNQNLFLDQDGDAKIDKVVTPIGEGIVADNEAPEAIIQFDLKNKDIVIVGKDNVTVTPQVVSHEGSVIISDEAGNTTEVEFSEKNRKKQQQASLVALTYHGKQIDLAKNRIKFKWMLDKQGQIKSLTQHLRIKGELYIELDYRNGQTHIKGRSENGLINKKMPGLALLQITTNKGQLNYATITP